MTVSAASVATGLSVVSSVMGSSAAKKRARAARRAAEAEAKQLEKRAGQEEAYGKREAIEIQRQGEVLKSKGRVSMVAGGGVSDDAGALEIESSMDKAIDYNAYAAIYEATMKAEDTRESARVVRKGGRATASAIRAEGRADALRGVSSALMPYAKF